MNFEFTPEQEKLRGEVRQFLLKEAPAESLKTRDDVWANVDSFDREFARKVGKKGWIGMTWPKEWGGGGYNYIDRIIVNEEMLLYGAPVMAYWTNDRQMGPAILAHGSEEQKREFLPRMIAGEISMCIGMSEPEAGSDLASVQTRAVEKEDCFIISGQKLWTGGAYFSNYIYLVVRTDPNVPKHRGLSEFIVDLKLPGVTVRPVADFEGHHGFNEVFFDEVRVPKTALVGKKNNGWYQIIGHLDYERAGLERCMSNRRLFLDFQDYCKEEGLFKDPLVRHRVAELEVEFQVARLLCYQVAWVLTEGRVPNIEAALAKAYGEVYMKRVAATITQILGLYGQLMPKSKYVPLMGRVAQNYLFSPSYTLMAGSHEIQRSVLATRGLGLPRG